MNKTGIQYLDYTWNPVTGCTYGCPECWARATAHRMAENPKLSPELRECYRTFLPTLHPDRLAEPAKFKKPSVIGVCFMGDLFDPAFPERYAPLKIMKGLDAAPWHNYVFLTKRASAMWEIFKNWRKEDDDILHNWYLGVTVRNQGELDRAAGQLRKLASLGWKTWISVEPMQGPVKFPDGFLCDHKACGDYSDSPCDPSPCSSRTLSGVILGGQSGPNAPPLPADWVRTVRDQCEAAGVPFMFKQWGTHQGRAVVKDDGLDPLNNDPVTGFPLLDGRTHTALPWKLLTK